MSKVNIGQRIAPRTLTSILSQQVQVPDSHRLVHLQFRRYAGCPICDLHVRGAAARHGDIVATGRAALAALESKLSGRYSLRGPGAST